MKVDQAILQQVEEHVPSSDTTVGVVFVHGVGEQKESETVREFGGALIGWLQEWHRNRDLDLTVVTSNLTYGDDVRPARFRILLPAFKQRPAQTWHLAEAWWASRLDPPGFVTLCTWGWRILWSDLARLAGNVRDTYSVPEDESAFVRGLSAAVTLVLIIALGISVFVGALWLAAAGLAALVGAAFFFRALIRGTDRLTKRARRRRGPVKDDAPRVHRYIGNASSFLLQLFLAAAAVIGYPLIAVMFALAQIPISQVQEFILFKTLRFFLVSRIGDFYTFMYDDIQAVHIRGSVPYAVNYLREKLTCKRVVVVAHSMGTVIAYDALASRAVPKGAVQELVTFGTALKPAKDLGPKRTTRLADQLPGRDFRWVDVWSAFDNVSGSPTQSPAPATRSVARRDPDESIEVTNSLSILTDHGDYFTNSEEFLSRLAREIDPDKDEADDRPSRFDPGAAGTTWVRRRRDRIFTMVGWRVAAIVGLFVALGYRCFSPADLLRKDGERLWGALSTIGVAGDAVKWLDQTFAWAQPIEPGLARLFALVVWLGVFLLFYAQAKRFLFANWHGREADASSGEGPPGRTQRTQIAVRSVFAIASISAVVAMIGGISSLASCATLSGGCDIVYLALSLVLFVVIAGCVDEIVRSEGDNPRKLITGPTVGWLFSAFVIFVALVFVTGPWAVATRMAVGPLPDTLFLAAPRLPYDVINGFDAIGRANYEATVWLDLLFPIFYVAAFGSAAWLLFTKKVVPVAALTGVVAIVGTGLTDWIENSLVLRLFDASTPPEWLPVLMFVTSAKRLFIWVFIGAALAVPIVRLGQAMWKWISERIFEAGAIPAWIKWLGRQLARED